MVKKGMPGFRFRKRYLLYLALLLHGLFIVAYTSVQFYHYFERCMTEQIFQHEALNLDIVSPRGHTYFFDEDEHVQETLVLNRALMAENTIGTKIAYNPRQVFVTLINSETYVTAAATLAQSLNEVNSSRKLLVMVTGNMSEAALEPLKRLGCIVLRKEPLQVPKKILETFLWASWEHAFSKLLIWTLDYDKVVWLDVDTIVLRNMDEIFSFPELSATRDFGGYGTCSLKRRINSGLMVVKPNATTLEEILEFFTTLKTLYDGDQELIYKYFASKQKVNRISQNYLLFVGRCNCVGETSIPGKYSISPSVKALHFSGHVIDFATASLHARKEEPCVQETFTLWRNVYDRMRQTVAQSKEPDLYDYNEGPSELKNEQD